MTFVERRIRAVQTAAVVVIAIAVGIVGAVLDLAFIVYPAFVVAAAGFLYMVYLRPWERPPN